MAEAAEYLNWLAGGDDTVPVIDTVEISHPVWGSEFLANWDQNLECTLETGASVTFQASRFVIQPTEVNDTTGQDTSLALSAYGGGVYDVLNGLTMQERSTPIEVVYRLYLLSDLSTVLINPPPRWVIHSIEASLEAVVAEIRAEPLRIRRIGLYYTQNEFPVLVYR